MNADFIHQDAPSRAQRLNSSSSIQPNFLFTSQANNLCVPPSQSNADYVRLEPFTDLEIRERPREHKSTFSRQARALFQKNFALQAKQPGTNLCQLATPILCLLLLVVVKGIIDTKVNSVVEIQMDYPFMFNIPYSRMYNNLLTPIKIQDCLQWYLYDFENATNETKDFVPGLLTNVVSHTGNSEDFYNCRQCDESPVPFFTVPVNGTINQQIYQSVSALNEQTYTANEDSPGLYLVPDGAITFFEANARNLSYKIQINDLNFPEYHRGNGVTKISVYDFSSGSTSNTMRTSDGELIMIDLVSKSYLQTINPNVVLASGSQYMPMAGMEANLLLRFLSMTEAILYPIALSLLLPVLMYTLVLEKEERLREMMKMNGLRMRNYWIVNYIWNVLLYLPSAITFLVFGIFVLKMPFFTQTSLLVLCLMLFGWGLCQASLSFFFQNFFSKSTVVTIMGYMLSIWTTIIAVALNIAIFPAPQELSIVFKIYPPFAFCRLIYDLCTSCSNDSCINNISYLTSEMKFCFAVLYLGALVFLIIALYMEQVWPQDYGVAKHPLFFLKCWNKNNQKRDDLPINIIKAKKLSSGPMGVEDEDAQQERDFVDSLQAPFDDYPLVIKHLRKVYKASGKKKGKVAVKDFCLHVNKGEIFGLLGPNGAGKTSLFSMLTGLYKPENGNAWVAGYDILNQIEQVRTKMGVCPQFDLLWPELTIREHLMFYARMRGIPASQEKAIVEKAIAEVKLTRTANFKTKELSGGMKRRLSVAMALVGDPKIIFLDEPTTGLDPENRRQLWDILIAARNGRAMVLTTHSMEEADVLCGRIGIVAKGVLRCIGPQAKLKSLYGGGYHILINCQNELSSLEQIRGSPPAYCYQRVQEFIQKLLPGAVLKSEFNGQFVFQVQLEGIKLSKIFEKIEEKKEELGISDWGISEATLEDVFMEVVEASEDDLNK